MSDDSLALRVAQTLLSREGTGASWGIEIEEARVGYARVAMKIRADMLNGHRTVHGGMVFALADSAFAYACNSRNQNALAQAASITFLSTAREGEVLVAEAREAALSGRTGVYNVSVHTRDDARAIAHFTGQSRTVSGAVIELDQSQE
jgi:acyl-CoA thioesterase